MPFELETLILEATSSLEAPIRKIRRRRSKLANQLEDAAESMALNFYEANYATKGNRTKAFSIARQEAGESLGALRIAAAKGILTEHEARVPAELLERTIAFLWKLIR